MYLVLQVSISRFQIFSILAVFFCFSRFGRQLSFLRRRVSAVVLLIRRDQRALLTHLRGQKHTEEEAVSKKRWRCSQMSILKPGRNAASRKTAKCSAVGNHQEHLNYKTLTAEQGPQDQMHDGNVTSVVDAFMCCACLSWFTRVTEHLQTSDDNSQLTCTSSHFLSVK